MKNSGGNEWITVLAKSQAHAGGEYERLFIQNRPDGTKRGIEHKPLTCDANTGVSCAKRIPTK
jgi:hypothetical protein